MNTKCAHCKETLQHENDQPCPYCGKMGRTINVSASDGLQVRDDYAIQSTNSKTNRSTIHADSRNPTDTVILQKHIIDFVENNSDELNYFIEQLVKNFTTVLTLANSVFYRGFDASLEKHLTSNVIGPAPQPESGRYNKKNETCLYLIDNFDFLFSELESESILVQKYCVPICDFKIADLSPNNKSLHNSLALAFQMTESGKTSSGYNIEESLEQRGKNRYLVSQLLASHFKNYNWDGMYIPGVHGAAGLHYHNLALFSSITNHWEQWTESEYFKKSKNL